MDPIAYQQLMEYFATKIVKWEMVALHADTAEEREMAWGMFAQYTIALYQHNADLAFKHGLLTKGV